MAKIKYNIDKFINCICNYADGEEYASNKPFEIVGVNGAVFEGVFKYTIDDVYGASTKEFLNEGVKLIPDFTRYGIKATWEEIGVDIILHDTYIAIGGEVPIETNEFTNIYLTNNTELNELSKVRFNNLDDTMTDLGTFIINLYKLPFNLPSNIIVETKTDITLGNNKVDVKSSLINTDTVTLDFGNIEVVGKYNNMYDYVNTECILHLPYFDNIYIATEYVINQTINIKYVIDLYSSNCTVNIYSSFIDDIIENSSDLIGNSIPFIQNEYNNIVGTLTNNNKNTIVKPFIEVNRNIPYIKNNNIFGGSVVEYGKIGDYNGYLECDSLVLNTKATNQEQDTIKNILNKGVFI